MKRKHKRSRKGILKANLKNKTTKKQIKILLFIFICFALLVSGFYGARYFITHSRYFNITQVEIKNDFHLSGKEALEFCRIDKNTNIFLIDLHKLRQDLLKFHPGFKQVVITRVLPNKLEINIKKRKPVAQIKSARYFLVDETYFILPQVRNFPEADLPIIQGIDIKPARLKVGQIFKNESLKEAIALIQAISTYTELKRQRLISVDVSDINNIFFILGDNIEIKLGDKNYARRLELLDKIISDLSRNFNQIDYIDLRFRNPIIVPR